jgi:hypothetical protein
VEKVDTTIPGNQPLAVPLGATPEDSCSVQLSEKDAAAVLEAAENPPAPNEAAVAAAKWFLKEHG